MSTILSDKILSKMSPEDRASLGKAGKTTAELAAKNEIKSEKQLQEQCVALLLQRNIFVNVSRMDKRKTDKVGVPDLIFCFPCGVPHQSGMACAWECKLPGKSPTSEQVEVMCHMSLNGWNVRVIHTVEEMRDALRVLDEVFDPK